MKFNNRKKTQEEYANEIDFIISRDVATYQSDWFDIDKPIFLLPENKDKSFVLATRDTGCELLMLGGSNFNERRMNSVLGPLGNKKFYVCHPMNYVYNSKIHEITGAQVVSEISFFLPANWFLINNKNNYWELRNLPK